MRSSSIYIKFGSEAKYERLTFTSQVVTFNEIKTHLEKKKKIGRCTLLTMGSVCREEDRKV